MKKIVIATLIGVVIGSLMAWIAVKPLFPNESQLYNVIHGPAWGLAYLWAISDFSPHGFNSLNLIPIAFFISVFIQWLLIGFIAGVIWAWLYKKRSTQQNLGGDVAKGAAPQD
jgi:membrane associated rhomboid family serine protease